MEKKTDLSRRKLDFTGRPICIESSSERCGQSCGIRATSSSLERFDGRSVKKARHLDAGPPFPLSFFQGGAGGRAVTRALAGVV